GFFEGELERAKKDILARLEKGYKDRDKTESAQIVGQLVNNFLEQKPVPGIAWEYNFQKEHMPNITLDDVNSLIANYIKEDNRVIILTGPEKEGIAKVTEAEVQSVLDNIKNIKLTPYEDKEVAAALMTNIPPAGQITDYKKDEALGTTTLVLSNGATVT